MSAALEGGQEEGVGAAIGGLRICLPVEGDGWGRPCASCDHEVGKEAGVVGAHGAGEDADVGGGGLRICLARVTCMGWRRLALLSGG